MKIAVTSRRLNGAHSADQWISIYESAIESIHAAEATAQIGREPLRNGTT